MGECQSYFERVKAFREIVVDLFGEYNQGTEREYLDILDNQPTKIAEMLS